MAQSGLAVLDREQLARRTLGSEAMRVELLSLFVAEAERLLQQIAAARDPQTRSDRLLAMRALARSIGALQLEAAARVAESQADAPDLDLEPLEGAAADVIRLIRSGGP